MFNFHGWYSLAEALSQMNKAETGGQLIVPWTRPKCVLTGKLHIANT